jgi:hypothetical protein
MTNEATRGPADAVILARAAVKHDYRGDAIDAYAPELPTRFANNSLGPRPARSPLGQALWL